MSVTEVFDGTLKVNRDKGIVTFEMEGVTIFRVTHLRTPIPPDHIIDIVALERLTSYISVGEPKTGE